MTRTRAGSAPQDDVKRTFAEDCKFSGAAALQVSLAACYYYTPPLKENLFRCPAVVGIQLLLLFLLFLADGDILFCLVLTYTGIFLMHYCGLCGLL
jgi:hypothetical protein